jgi:hypothetical protein
MIFKHIREFVCFDVCVLMCCVIVKDEMTDVARAPDSRFLYFAAGMWTC